jgi:endonuclease/exonuclease/phosphatase family metal-dependent hydrolase
VETVLNHERTIPDILCFQEVQVDLWESELKPAIEAAAYSLSSAPRGRSLSYLEQLQYTLQQQQQQQQPVYTAILQKVKKKPIANAILVRNQFARILKQESRSRAVIAVLELPTLKHRLIVANVHLQAGEQEYHQMQRLYQISSLMQRIQTFIQQFSTDTITPSVVIVGDFNMTPSNPLYQLLLTGDLPQVSQSSNQHYQTTLTPENRELAQSIPLLPLRDAYRDCQPFQGALKSTYTTGDIIDYMWTTSSDPQAMFVHQTWQSHPDAALDAQGMFLKGQRYPNAQTPSDHLPIGAILELL